ncbi:MAG: hypothetical protein J4G13_02980 [Dehalococcoidia bacterium]|nr:hypothetical protein [Dehalococcoidia bacterium]
MTVLDRTISDFGRQRLAELIRESGDAPQRAVATADRINDSLNALANLAYRMPRYNDDWLALFYALWYQPKQINVAYRAIHGMRASRGLQAGNLISGQRLHIVDFGSGSLAMLFATALAVADALHRGEHLDSVRIDCIDNEEMIWTGALILEHFRQIVEQQDELGPLRDALESIHWEVNGIEQVTQAVQFEEDTERWFSALHVVYSDNMTEIAPAIHAMRATDPFVAFFTSFALKENLVRQVARPFEGAPYLPVERVQHAPHLGLTGVLTNTTNLRREIANLERLRPHLSETSVNFLTGRRSNVDCEPQSTFYRIYLRQ